MAPGAMTLTVMPRGASSIAQERASPTSAALLAAYWLRPADPPAVRLPISTILRCANPRHERVGKQGGGIDVQAPHQGARPAVQPAQFADTQHARRVHERRRRNVRKRGANIAWVRLEQIERAVLETRRRDVGCGAAQPCNAPAVLKQTSHDCRADAGASAGDNSVPTVRNRVGRRAAPARSYGLSARTQFSGTWTYLIACRK